ncbi:MAG: polysaccharide deacetylase family protein [Devosia sp.]
MADFKDRLVAAGFELLWASQLTRLIRRWSKARGVILRLDRVLPDDPPDFAPNSHMQVKPGFLDQLIVRLRELKLDIVGLDEAARRVEGDDGGRRFVVLTFDGAWRDNLRHALPVLRRQQAPFTLFVPTALVDGVGEVWAQALEDIVAGQNALAVSVGAETEYFATATTEEKLRAYRSLHRRLRGMSEVTRITLIRDLAVQYGLDLDAHCRELVMDWAELRSFAADPLCTIGAGTVHGYELAKLTPAEARSEIEQSLRILKAQFGKLPQHLSYPVGDRDAAGPREYAMARDLGLRTALTSRAGGLYPASRHSLHALPRVRLNGALQSRRYADVYATPAVFSLFG